MSPGRSAAGPLAPQPDLSLHSRLLADVVAGVQMGQLVSALAQQLPLFEPVIAVDRWG